MAALRALLDVLRPTQTPMETNMPETTSAVETEPAEPVIDVEPIIDDRPPAHLVDPTLTADEVELVDHVEALLADVANFEPAVTRASTWLADAAAEVAIAEAEVVELLSAAADDPDEVVKIGRPAARKLDRARERQRIFAEHLAALERRTEVARAAWTRAHDIRDRIELEARIEDYRRRLTRVQETFQTACREGFATLSRLGRFNDTPVGPAEIAAYQEAFFEVAGDYTDLHASAHMRFPDLEHRIPEPKLIDPGAYTRQQRFDHPTEMMRGEMAELAAGYLPEGWKSA